MNNISFVENKLNNFIQNKKVPNILFHGNHNSNKESIVKSFLEKLYKNCSSNTKNYLMIVNCAHGKGIKFVREDIKFFAKTNVPLEDGLFKSILLINAEELTTDAQSALRRCIEIFSHSTRFFLLVNNKEKLLKPIISRFCDIYIANYKENPISKDFKSFHSKTIKIIKTELSGFSKNKEDLFPLCEKLYDKGVSVLHILNYFESCKEDDFVNDRHILLFYINKIKKCIKDEKLLMLIILDLFFFECKIDLQNIDFI
jgi:hypothetical protein